MSNDQSSPGGRCNPPIKNHFQKGQSGNPRGRPKRKIEPIPYEAIFGQRITINAKDGQEKVTLEEAFLRQMINQGLGENVSAGINSLNIIKRLEEVYITNAININKFVTMNNFIFSVNDVMLPLKMAQKLNKNGPLPRILLEPWIVEAALVKLGGREFSAEEQREVWGATRTPNKVKWPAWWTERRGTGRRRPKAPLKDRGGFYPPSIIPRRADERAKRSR